ncbi:family 16 glycosylhydrolase, partial [bacterium]|nr:family 16 glycosylhydrolase [bacterium]
LEFYKQENVSVENGNLIITAKQESFGGKDYTSARIRTINKGDWTYGRFEFRAKLPVGQGIWPAIWMLPTDNVYGGWAASGEIDIMEYLGHQPNIIHGTLHYGGEWPANRSGGASFTLSEGTFNEAFHTFALEWEEGIFRWFVDDSLYQIRTDWFSANGEYPAPFDKRFHLLINLAVGGNWPGSPDTSTTFPQTFEVDYVRVYQKSSTTSVKDDKNEFPEEFALHQNYPNPFNPTTIINYAVASSGYVELKIYNQLGQEIRTLANSTQPAGSHQVVWDGRDHDGNSVPSGLYLYRLRAGSFVETRKILLLR